MSRMRYLRHCLDTQMSVYQMFSAKLAFCGGNQPVTAQRVGMRSFDIFRCQIEQTIGHTVDLPLIRKAMTLI